jgi:hypothetical protein
MAEIVPTTFPADGREIEMGNAASGDTAKCGAGLVLMVTNGSVASISVTIVVPGTTATGEANPDNVIPVPAGETWGIPLLDLYRDPTDRLAHISWSATTTVTRAVLKT